VAVSDQKYATCVVLDTCRALECLYKGGKEKREKNRRLKMQAAKKAVESVKETAANIGASAKSGLEKTKATLQEKVNLFFFFVTFVFVHAW